MRKVSVEEFTRLVRELPLGAELCFASFMPQDSSDPDDAEDWWVAQRVSLDKEEYTIVRHCGGITSRALVFDSPGELSQDFIDDFLEYSECLQDGCVYLESPASKEEKIAVRTVYGQVKPELERLIEVYSGDKVIRIEKGWIEGVSLHNGSLMVKCHSVNCRSGNPQNVQLSELTDDEIIEVYDALLGVINGE